MSWQSEPLSALTLKIGSGSTPRGGDSVYISEGTTLIRSQNVYNNEFSTDGLVYIDEKTAEKMKGVSVEKEDVLVNITGDSVARCCLVHDAVLPARVNQHVAILRTNPKKLLPHFLAFYMVSPFMQAKMLSWAGTGGTRKALTKGMLEGFEIPLPPVDVQDKIVQKIRTYNDLIENNRRRIQLLEESARLLYQEWFVHLRFPGHEQVKIIDGVPEGWEKMPLKQIATLNYGKALKAEVRVPGPFPVYGSSGEVGSHEKPLVKGPGIVVGRKGNVGSVYWVNTDFYPIDTVYFISAEESSLFLYHALQNVQFINTDVAVPGLNRDMAYSREILVPDDKNYQRFLSEVVPIQEQINKLQDYNIKLAQARDLLLPKLMSGELTV
ncbi:MULTISPECIES: restriction endonuclease subunit S [Enterobacterales]|uniref:restriction endonuclease subunit S n=1 Tax=Enterobacterales TaxID=91347 RepID=UPI000E20A758|nr:MULTISPECIES: restriction endonuclease subunit S [Enterobacterales]ECC7825297.1 restriction endonuclease subunit S [Salmonella enterica]MCP5785303.1 restriction endonuclease subunit S [Klebsiella pneumoniae]EFB4776943.1 restriction endonuclease subunit S [Escherichia coli]EFC6764127.1 restriction endonuclease subunit S [Escherichia coli]EGM7605546.1 restriction endonuclease subunit S [Escherichia coli]